MVHAVDDVVNVEYVRHLLAHLDSPTQLRRNPLIAHRLEPIEQAADAVSVARAIVIAAVNTLRKHPRNARLHQIVVRCGINGEPRKQVAYDLGISVRQLHRDVHTAYERLAFTLSSSLVERTFSGDATETWIARLLHNASSESSPQRRLTLVLLALDQITQQLEGELALACNM